ncbi:MAG: c-type cytochrome biogenesis protein CcmI [Alphaproteobacteria bacterium]|nr:c-type cytochrome biogenesis protein CcmI [Alphaproteobacteria bacterium]
MMMLWFVIALMTAAAVFAVLWPLRRHVPQRGGSDIEVYRDQLEEIERDRAAGMIAEREAEAAQVEISRRLLAAADSAPPAKPVSGAVRRRRIAAFVALVLLPFGAVSFYLQLGSPQLPSQPLQARGGATTPDRSASEMVGRIEAYLKTNPDDGQGWEMVGSLYLRMGLLDEAVKARRNSLRLLGSSPERQANLGEALVGAANGVVTEEAKAIFGNVLRLDPRDVRSRFFMGLAAEQDGRTKDAAETWRALLADATPDADWAGFVRESLARVDPAPAAAAKSGPGAAEMAAANEMTPEQRQEMIQGMVGRLAERLKRDGSDVNGWIMLVRSYTVLGAPAQARAAADEARQALASDPEKLKLLNESIVREMAQPAVPAVAAAPPRPVAPSPAQVAPGPSAADMAAANDLSPEQRNTMIRGMVARLAERLKQDGSDVEGWLRLLRAYMVLGDKDQARAAAVEARRALASDPGKLRQVDEMIKGLGIEG